MNFDSLSHISSAVGRLDSSNRHFLSISVITLILSRSKESLSIETLDMLFASSSNLCGMQKSHAQDELINSVDDLSCRLLMLFDVEVEVAMDFRSQ